jgi:hypothetical protein
VRFLKFIRGKKIKKKASFIFARGRDAHAHSRGPPPRPSFWFFFGSPFLLVARRLTTSRRACFGEFELEEEEERE